MAWRCSGQSNAELVRNLVNANIIRSPIVQQAMQSTDRAYYTASSRAYEDAPQQIPRPAGISTIATLSAPHVHALALETLLPHLRPDSRVLDVGCGSGYLMACLSRIIHPGRVVGIDHMPYLTRGARTNLARDLGEDAQDLFILEGDGWLGVPEHAPYDAIHVGAAAREIPTALVEQLKCPGIMFIPVGEAHGDQYVYIVSKDEQGQVTRVKGHGVRYVPLE